LFSTCDGTPLMQRNIRRRHFQPALEALGLTGIRPHDFRRSFVALHWPQERVQNWYRHVSATAMSISRWMSMGNSQGT